MKGVILVDFVFEPGSCRKGESKRVACLLASPAGHSQSRRVARRVCGRRAIACAAGRKEETSQAEGLEAQRRQVRRGGSSAAVGPTEEECESDPSTPHSLKMMGWPA